jgi:predicted ATP-grasp superfamily ATP-dependent carboligase
LVFEYITGGGLLAEPLPPGLAREGGLMLEALLRDLADIPGVRPVALRDARLAAPPELAGRVEWLWLSQGDDAEQRFREQITLADAVWPIAPETGGILENLCALVEAAGKPLLTSPAAAVRLTASKLDTLNRLGKHNVSAIPTAPLVVPPLGGDCAAIDRLKAGLRADDAPLVMKPDDGVGCEGTRIIATPDEWQAFLDHPPAGSYIAQPLLDGEALSFSALFATGRAYLLTCNRQHIVRRDGGFTLTGCGVNAAHEWRQEFESLAENIAAALPELWGYAGVDVIRSERGLTVLEVNPRLTTSYAGLRGALGVNPAALVLNLWQQGCLPEPPIYFSNVVEIPLESNHAH